MIPGERWLLPEGIEESLPEQARRLERLRRKLLDLYHAWGYELVLTPFIEYLESLLIGTSSDLDLQTFKLTDQINGRMMGVRADMTPQVARIDAHVLQRKAPARLCYIGTVLRTRPDSAGGTRSPMQVGAELYGHTGLDSDLEIIALMLETLEAAGLRDIYMDLGHVGIFRNLIRQAGLEVRDEYVLFDLLQRKACPELEETLGGLKLPAGLREMLVSLASLDGGDEVLDEARRVLRAAGRAVLEIIDHLERLAGGLRVRQTKVDLHFDLAELRGYHYHTGVVFAAYQPGIGYEVARGGRYDDIGAAFGRARPANGFSTDLKTLCALSDAGVDGDRLGVFVRTGDVAAAAETIAALRRDGARVICELEGQAATAREMGCDRELANRGDEWFAKEIE